MLDEANRRNIDYQLEHYRELYEAGEPACLLFGIRQCAMFDIVMPRWVAGGFIEGMSKWTLYEKKGLGEAFDVERKGVHAEQRRTQALYGGAVYLRVEELRKAGRSIGSQLFEAVGKEFNIGGSTARDFYYSAKKGIRTYTYIAKFIDSQSE